MYVFNCVMGVIIHFNCAIFNAKIIIICLRLLMTELSNDYVVLLSCLWEINNEGEFQQFNFTVCSLKPINIRYWKK